MTINCCVDGEDKDGEIHQEPRLECANEAITPLGDMGMKAVEQNCQAWDVEDIAATKHRNVGVVAHLD